MKSFDIIYSKISHLGGVTSTIKLHDSSGELRLCTVAKNEVGTDNGLYYDVNGKKFNYKPIAPSGKSWAKQSTNDSDPVGIIGEYYLLIDKMPTASVNITFAHTNDGNHIYNIIPNIDIRIKDVNISYEKLISEYSNSLREYDNTNVFKHRHGHTKKLQEIRRELITAIENRDGNVFSIMPFNYTSIKNDKVLDINNWSEIQIKFDGESQFFSKAGISLQDYYDYFQESLKVANYFGSNYNDPKGGITLEDIQPDIHLFTKLGRSNKYFTRNRDALNRSLFRCAKRELSEELSLILISNNDISIGTNLIIKSNLYYNPLMNMKANNKDYLCKLTAIKDLTSYGKQSRFYTIKLDIIHSLKEIKKRIISAIKSTSTEVSSIKGGN